MAQPNSDVIVIRSFLSPNAVDYDISDLVNFHIVEFDGLGLPPIQHDMQAGPQQDGATHLGFRLLPRVVTISIAALSQTPGRFHGKRIQLLKVLAPTQSYVTGATAAGPLYPSAALIKNAPLQLRWTFTRTTAAGASVTETRVLYCYYHAGLQMASSRMVRNNFTDSVQLIAPNPLWWEESIVSYVPSSLGTGTIDATFTIDRTSDENAWDTFPVITITGPATGVVITNNSYGLQIYRTGTLALGIVNKLDLRPGIKTIVDAALNPAAAVWFGDLGSFRLGRGVNQIRFQCTAGSVNTAMIWDYYRSFIGI